MKVLLGVLLAAVLAFLIWYFTRKKATVDENGNATAPPPPTATPPIQGATGLQDTETGAAKAAIDRRISELKKSNVAAQIELECQQEIDILKGVTASKVAYYNQNISRPPITSAKKVPLNLSTFQRSALTSFLTIDGSQRLATADNLLGANRQMFSEFSTCYIGGPELENRDNFIRQVYCQGYVDCGKKYKEMLHQPALLGGGQKATEDMGKMSSAWLAGADLYEARIRTRAIEDLRAAGWRFVGFDF